MSSSKKNLRGILDKDAELADGPSDLTRRLLNDDELDWMGGGGDHSQSGSGSQYTMSGNNSFLQTGGTYYQDANSFSYWMSSGTVGQKITPPNDGGGST